jgi:hypothetical protein
MRDFASQDKLTLKRAAASLAVSTAENSSCGSLIGVFLQRLEMLGQSPMSLPEKTPIIWV